MLARHPIKEVRAQLRSGAEAKRARILQGYFKSGPGEYGEHDAFLGVSVPQIRRIARRYQHMALSDVQELLKSNIHEERALALFILALKFKRSEPAMQGAIFRFYLRNLRFVNNWDLVDGSARHIVGPFLVRGHQALLSKLVRSRRLWDRRVAILSTLHLIEQRRFDITLRVARALLNDEHDLIHKAVGWMLREIGKRDLKVAEDFLLSHYHNMPRTMLRYATERFPAQRREAYLRGAV